MHRSRRRKNAAIPSASRPPTFLQRLTSPAEKGIPGAGEEDRRPVRLPRRRARSHVIADAFPKPRSSPGRSSRSRSWARHYASGFGRATPWSHPSGAANDGRARHGRAGLGGDRGGELLGRGAHPHPDRADRFAGAGAPRSSTRARAGRSIPARSRRPARGGARGGRRRSGRRSTRDRSGGRTRGRCPRAPHPRTPRHPARSPDPYSGLGPRRARPRRSTPRARRGTRARAWGGHVS